MSGGILRRLVTILGFDIQQTEFDKAELAVRKLKTSINTVVGIFAGGMVARGVVELVRAASDTEETMNVLRESFGEGATGVATWAEQMAGSMSRSQYMLREFAGATGAIVEPMLGSKEAAAEMSMKMAELAVDLGSFFNANDEDALRALQSGLVGQAEPLRRFGVILMESTLQEYARAQGVTKSVQAMTEAEKVQLRYRYILDKTKTAQGDAMRTADGFANASKGLMGGLRDVAVMVGKTMLPGAAALVKTLTDGIRKTLEWVKGTAVFEVVLGALASAAGIAAFVLSAKLLAALGGVAKTAVMAAAGLGSAGKAAFLMQLKSLLLGGAFLALIGILILVGDEIVTALKGGDTLFGKFTKKIEDWYDGLMNKKGAGGFLDWLLAPFKALLWYLNETKKLIYAVFMAMTGDFSGFRLLGDEWGERLDSVKGKLGAVKDLVTGLVGNVFGGGAPGKAGMMASLQPQVTTVPVSPGGVSNSRSVVNAPQNTVTVHVQGAPGQSPEAVGRAAGDSVFAALEEQNARTLRDLTPMAPAGAR